VVDLHLFLRNEVLEVQEAEPVTPFVVTDRLELATRGDAEVVDITGRIAEKVGENSDASGFGSPRRSGQTINHHGRGERRLQRPVPLSSRTGHAATPARGVQPGWWRRSR
jgi:hypothetical protein